MYFQDHIISTTTRVKYQTHFSNDTWMMLSLLNSCNSSVKLLVWDNGSLEQIVKDNIVNQYMSLFLKTFLMLAAIKMWESNCRAKPWNKLAYFRHSWLRYCVAVNRSNIAMNHTVTINASKIPQMPYQPSSHHSGIVRCFDKVIPHESNFWDDASLAAYLQWFVWQCNVLIVSQNNSTLWLLWILSLELFLFILYLHYFNLIRN